jgi:acyl-CoA reductase-like NAD-dependent aldehyde dehydrogenase
MSRLSVYSPLATWKKGEYPITPFVHVAVAFHSEADGQVLLSPPLMTEKEVDDEVDALVRELEAFRQSAKKELATILAHQLK